MKKIYFIIFSLFATVSYAQMTTHSYAYDGVSREFNLYIPSSYSAATDTLPMVFFLHGMGGNMNNFSGLTYKAEQEKFIMVIPQAINDPNAGTTWHSGAGALGIYPNANIDDVGFMSSLIDSVSTWYQIDDDRIYSTGFSMGGFMSNRLACELGDKIAAIASVSGTMGNEIKNSCNPENTIPVLHIHSQTDATVAYQNNTFGNDAEELVDFWIQNNNCDTPALVTDLSNVSNDGFTAVKYLYTGGDLDSEVEFYKLNGPEHNESWYNVTSNNDFDAIEVIWDFFERNSNKKELSVGMEEPNAITNIKNARFDVYPNPATDQITLSFKTPVILSSIIISNTLGKTLETKYFDKAITKSAFDLREKAPGIYFFQIKDLEGNLSVLRFYKK